MDEGEMERNMESSVEGQLYNCVLSGGIGNTFKTNCAIESRPNDSEIYLQQQWKTKKNV